MDTTTRTGTRSTSTSGTCIRGIPNYGQTCFLNSVLQALGSLDSFLSYLEVTNSVSQESSVSSTSHFAYMYRNGDYESNDDDDDDDDDDSDSVPNHPNSKISRTRPSQTTPTDSLAILLHELLCKVNGRTGQVQRRSLSPTLNTTNKSGIFTDIIQHKQRNCTSNIIVQSLDTRTDDENDNSKNSNNINQQEDQEDQEDDNQYMTERKQQNIEPSTSITFINKMLKVSVWLSDSMTNVVTNTCHQLLTNNSVVIDTRQLLQLVAMKHPQFRRLTYTSPLSMISSTEHQQDAQEFLQALVDMLVQNSFSTQLLQPFSSLVQFNTSTTTTTPGTGTCTISSISPTPFTGWIGNTIQCCKCHHTRPIQALPFIDIPLVPTEISQLSSGRTTYNSKKHYTTTTTTTTYPFYTKQQSSITSPPCTIDECLYDFIATERVADVQCRSCTIQTQKQRYEEDAWMVQGAIRNATKKQHTSTSTSRQRGSSVSVSANANVKTNDSVCYAEHSSKPQLDTLQIEYSRAMSIVTSLQQMSPDDDDDDKPLMIPISIEEHLLTSSANETLPTTSSKYRRVPLEKHDAYKSLPLLRLPTILTLHIQRRYFDPVTNTMIKSNQHVAFKEYWNVAPYCSSLSSPSPSYSSSSLSSNNKVNTVSHSVRLYRLMSVIEHQGNASFGHYICYRRYKKNNNTTTTSTTSTTTVGNDWLYISDETIRPCSWNTVSRCQAYMLFYEQVL